MKAINFVICLMLNKYIVLYCIVLVILYLAGKSMLLKIKIKGISITSEMI